MAGSGWRWYSFIVQVLKQQQKKKMEKKRQKYASLEIGQSVLWRLLTHVGALVVLFYVLFVLGSQGEVLSPLP